MASCYKEGEGQEGWMQGLWTGERAEWRVSPPEVVPDFFSLAALLWL